MNSDARYSGADAAPGAGILNVGSLGSVPATSVDDGVSELRTQTSLLSEESKANSIASHGLGIVVGAQPEKSTSIAGCGGDCACAPLPSNGEESPKQIIDAAAEETGPKELGGPVTAGVDKLCDLSCSVLQKFMSWTARKRTENLYIADGDIETPDETPNEPPVSDWKPVRSGEKGDECADALTRDSQLTSECKFLKNSTIDARSVGEISEITRERPRGFLPSTRLGRKPPRTHEEEEPGTPGTDIATIGKFSTFCFLSRGRRLLKSCHMHSSSKSPDPENVNENWHESAKRIRRNKCKSFVRFFVVGTLLAGTAGLVAWGLVDTTDGDDKHAILDTFSSWFGRGNGGEAESLREIESYDAINVDNGSGSPKETEGNDATNGENGGDETSWPTFSPSGMPI